MTLEGINQEGTHPFDEVRIEQGPDKLIDEFQELFERDSDEAIEILNRDNLQFPSLYVLIKYIEELEIHEGLTEKNRIAIEIVKDILSGDDRTPATPYRYPICDHFQMVHSVFGWIVATGSYEDMFGNDYSQVIDTSITILVRDFGDRTKLNLVADLIFIRLKNGADYFDLVWAFFESQYPYSMLYLADRLLSMEETERALAERLLGFVLEEIPEDSTPRSKFWAVQSWLEENGPYLHYQNESFNMTSRPKRYMVVWDAKYLGRPVDTETGIILGQLSAEEDRFIGEFREIDQNAQIRLANFSYVMRNQSLRHWQAWLNIPVIEKVKEDY
jgi:hypothetical protein